MRNMGEHLPIYLDHAATSPLLKEAYQAMEPWLKEDYANPSSVYTPALKAKSAVAKSRRAAAALIGADAREICFTSGGSEADNQAILGAALLGRAKGKHIITSKIEHPAVIKTMAFLEELGYEVTYLDVDPEGFVRVQDVEAAVREDTILISIMMANNEVGTIQPISRIGEIAREHDILFHTDAVQAVGHIPVDVQELQVDLLSASAHKFGGPKGCGFLYIRRGVLLPSFIHGGDQERGRRAGTENVAGIVGMGSAALQQKESITSDGQKMAHLRSYLEERIRESIPSVRINGAGNASLRLPGHLSIAIRDVSSEMLLILLDEASIYASAGSACSSGSLEPSHVLKAMGVPQEYLKGSLRFSIGPENSLEEMDYVADTLKKAVERL